MGVEQIEQQQMQVVSFASGIFISSSTMKSECTHTEEAIINAMNNYSGRFTKLGIHMYSSRINSIWNRYSLD